MCECRSQVEGRECDIMLRRGAEQGGVRRNAAVAAVAMGGLYDRHEL